MVTIVVGGQFGDEGKGKIVSYIAQKDNPEIIARAGVGPNAGHTVYKNGKKFGLRMIPCGFVNDDSKLLIGAGVLVDTERFLEEVEITGTKGRIFIDERCTVIEQKHRDADAGSSFLKNKIGTTGRGCGPANADRVNRTAKLARDEPALSAYIADVPLEIDKTIKAGGDVIVECSQGFGLSVYNGTYPYVTSKDTTASMAAVDIGIGPTKVDDVIIIYKAYMTRVGEGPMQSLITDENISKYPIWAGLLEKAEKQGLPGANANEKIAELLGEKGTVTKRLRRVGNFDFELAKRAAMINGATQIGVTCIDKIFPECYRKQHLEDLPKKCMDFIRLIEKKVGVSVTLISTGPEPEDIVDLRKV